VLLDPDDVVLVELPTYTGAITAFRNVQAAMVGVPQEADGIDLAALDETYARLTRAGRRVRFLYVVPNFQNPTGLLLAQRKRRQLLEWLSRRNLLLLEDDPYRDLYFTDATTEADVRAVRADDDEGRVVYLSSFSKTIAPGYRVAWIDAPAPLAAKLEVAKQAEDLCTGGFDQRVILEACRRGILARQLPMLRAHYQQKRDVMVEALRASFGSAVTWPDPRGGFFLWATLPPEVNADAMIPRAVKHGVIYVAGEAFYVSEPEDGPRGRNIVRLSFSAPSPERIREGVRRLAAAVDEEITERRRPAAAPPGAVSPSPAAR
jgi:DNA-binding transcriptional MocR family regulator